MKLLLASPRGFCAGVEMAIDALNRMLERFQPPIYCLHQVVHNEVVVLDFERRGVVFVDMVDEVPVGATLALSAHGVSPVVRDQAARRQLHVIDLTCPLVTKVHREARRFAAEGRLIALVGHPGHDEVVGVVGEVPDDGMVLVQSPDDVRNLPDSAGRPLAYLTQTTLSVEETREVLEALHDRFPGVTGPARDDICYATQNRQDAIRRLARDAGLTLVIGSSHSANTCNLVKAALSEGSPAYRIDGPEDIDPAWIQGVDVVAVTSGASAPEAIVQDVVQYFVREYHADVEERSLTTEHTHFALPHELQNR